MICPLKESDFDKMFAVMSVSFPPDEHRPYDEQKALLANPYYHIFGINGNSRDELKAFIAVWDFAEFLYVEHFAVNPAFRNEGLGTKILDSIKSMFPKTLCLEVEPPNDEMSKRRISFYERNGFYLNDYPYIQPPISKGKNEVPLMLMTSGSESDFKTLDFVKDTLYKYVYQVTKERKNAK